jgi:hypothetical protein
MAYIICMMVPVMLGIISLWRFHVRETRRSIAQAQRRQEGVQWVKRKIRRAVVLAQDINELHLVDTLLLKASNIVAHETETRTFSGHHARSLACTASPDARRTLHVCGKMLCANFREYGVDNWRSKATADALYKAVHKAIEETSPAPVAQETQVDELKPQPLQSEDLQVAREFYAPDGSGPKAGESEFERALRKRRMRKLSGIEKNMTNCFE